MHGERPSAEEVRFREFVRRTGSILSGQLTQIEIHHPAGRTAVQDGIPIGHRYILPLTRAEHKLVDQGKQGLEEMKMIYEGRVGAPLPDNMSLHEFEKFLYQLLLMRVYAKDPQMHPSDEVFQAIRRYKK